MAPSTQFVAKTDRRLMATALLGVQREKGILIMFEYFSQIGRAQ